MVWPTRATRIPARAWCKLDAVVVVLGIADGGARLVGVEKGSGREVPTCAVDAALLLFDTQHFARCWRDIARRLAAFGAWGTLARPCCSEGQKRKCEGQCPGSEKGHLVDEYRTGLARHGPRLRMSHCRKKIGCQGYPRQAILTCVRGKFLVLEGIDGSGPPPNWIGQ